jgi:hypothetical protein
VSTTPAYPNPGSDLPKFIRHPWRWIKWWFKDKPPTNRSGTLIAISSIFAAGILTILGGLLLNQIEPSGNVPGYFIVLAAGLFLSTGVGLAWWLTRKLYELELHAKESDAEKVQAQFEKVQAQLELEKKKLASFEPSEETLRRFGEYSEHVYSLSGSLISGEVSLRDLSSDDATQAICRLTEKYLVSATGREFKVSIWGEITDPGTFTWLRKAVNDVTPDAIGDLASRRKFEIFAAPEHTPTEHEAFAVKIEPSWLKHCQRQEAEHAEQLVFEADEPHLSALRGDDIAAFAIHGYQSVRAISFRRDGMHGYLVVLSKMSDAFSQIEGRYLLWLKRILELDMVISPEGPSQP